MYLVDVNVETCDGCEECVNNCPQMVFRMVDGKSEPYQPGECVYCETCISLCPTSSITIKEM